VRVAAAGEFVALLANDALVDATPLDCGVKVTVKPALCPEGIVTGNVRPLMANSELPTVTPVTVTLAPVALSDPVWVPLVPTVTLPTPIVLGLTLSCPCVDPVAEPLREMVRFVLEAFEAIATLPVKLPADCGANVTVKVVLCPGVSVTGALNPEMLKPVPETVPCEIVAFKPPVFCTVSVCA
jgi:hypothetical protein